MSRRGGSKKDVLRTLRGILKAVKAKPSVESIQSEWPQYVLSQYRINQDVKDKNQVRSLRARALDYFELLRSVDEQKYLRSLDMGVERLLSAEERVTRSATRVGLHVPQDIEDLPVNDVTERYQKRLQEKLVKRQADSAKAIADEEHKQG